MVALFERCVVLYGCKTNLALGHRRQQFEGYVILYGFKTDDNEPKFS
ncbi:hypothetical protein ANHA31_32600 [Anaerobutyricum hallii]|nr:hypothetical protein ANHA31_32600 [Anaerobutyricum hallii]